MRWSLHLLLLGLTVSINQAVPCGTVTTDQTVLKTAADQVDLANAGTIVRSPSELDSLMQKELDREFNVTTDIDAYMIAIFSQIIDFDEFRGWSIDTPVEPHIEVIPTKRLSHDILCTDPTCTIKYQGETTISTIHSSEAGLSTKLNAAPFGIAVALTPSPGYGFSMGNRQSAAVSQEFILERGASGYFAIVNAQISAGLVVQYCESEYQHCKGEQWDKAETGYHESVIMYNAKPFGILAFVLN
ncbi:hypothetical protein BGZ75_005352 [Mortierella antarctica]|nr:hypothetical protein BGZ75_005352 [Mortierella antarctica]